MNREQAKQLLPIIQAFADGAHVQFKDSRGEWVTASDDPGLLYGAEWRIKPKPLERWVIAHNDGWIHSSYEDEAGAVKFVSQLARMGNCTYYRVVHFREVTE